MTELLSGSPRSHPDQRDGLAVLPRWLSRARSEWTPPSPGICRVSASSSRVDPAKVRAAASSLAGSANRRLMCPPETGAPSLGGHRELIAESGDI